MDARREQAAVGLFVLIAAGLLIVTVFSLGGAFSSSAVTYRTYFHNVGGIEPGATVRYQGGSKIGRVEMLRIDPQNPARMEMTFSVRPDVPIKMDSVVSMLSFSPLGEYHIGLTYGTPQSPSARPGSVLPSEPYYGIADITKQLNDIAPEAKKLLLTLNQRTTELQETIARVNDMLNAQNRTNLSATLSTTRGMLEENRSNIKSSLNQVEAASHKMSPLLDDLRKTSAEANKTLDHVDSVLEENRPDIHKAIVELRQNLTHLQKLTRQ